MSNYSTKARRPGGEWEKVQVLGDIVVFQDGHIFYKNECQFKNCTPTDMPEFFKDIFNPKK